MPPGVCCAAANNLGIVGVAPNARFAYFAGRTATGAPGNQDFNELMMGVYDAFNAKAPILNTSWTIDLPHFDVLDSAAKTAISDFSNVKSYWQPRIKRWLDNSELPTIWVTSVANQLPLAKCYKVTVDGLGRADDSLPGNADPRIITVGGDSSCYYVNGSTWLDLSGPTGLFKGTGVLAPWFGASSSTLSENGLHADVGTSFATPAVAGVVNLLRDWNPNLGRGEIETILKTKASFDRVESTTQYAEQFGRGYVDAYASLLHAERYYGQGVLDVRDMEYVAYLHEKFGDLVPLVLEYTVDEDTTKQVSVSLENSGDGVLIFQGLAYRCLEHSFLGICINNNSDISFAPALMSAVGYHSLGDKEVDEGYLRPGDRQNVRLEISGIGMSAGDVYDGTVYFFSDASHHDVYNSDYFWMNVKVRVTKPGDCFTSRALIGTPMEQNIPGLRKFRDDYMVPQRAHGQKWANLYRTYGPEIAKGFDHDAPEVYRYRMIVDRFGPSLVAKGLKESGLSILANEGALRKVITKDDIMLAQSLMSALANANPKIAEVGQRLSNFAEELEGMTAEEAIEYVTAQDPDRL